MVKATKLWETMSHNEDVLFGAFGEKLKSPFSTYIRIVEALGICVTPG